MNDNEFKERMQFYRQRRARNVSLSVMGYFVGVACVIGCSVFWSAPVFGVILFMLISAASTGLIIYTKMSTPLEFSNSYNDDYIYEDYDRAGDGASYDSGYSTRDVSTETNGTEGADGASGAGPRAKLQSSRLFVTVRRFRSMLRLTRARTQSLTTAPSCGRASSRIRSMRTHASSSSLQTRKCRALLLRTFSQRAQRHCSACRLAI